MGCFKDKKQPRALPKMLLTDRDPTDKVSSGITIDWKNWDDYLKGFICRCAKSAISEGYNFMGLQFYGECWSGPNPAQYKRHGASSDCITYAYKPCTGGDCIGKKSTNYVYGVQARGSSPTNKPTETETLPTTLPTTPTPTKRPSPSPTGTGTPTRKPEPTLSPTRMLSGLLCQSFVVSLCTRQDTSGMEQPCDLCGLIRNIYTGYPCFRSVEIIGTRLLQLSSKDKCRSSYPITLPTASVFMSDVLSITYASSSYSTDALDVYLSFDALDTGYWRHGNGYWRHGNGRCCSWGLSPARVSGNMHTKMQKVLL
ncbi:predicted protein [Nematostella vectensis]|uniref:Uncharacterized protein n=1 Tax=Nematostella vectensis TaxID=45351 RepID=A7RPJ0_NEMVE|nr:predicted protein [Nematostella vectensis]|eukprot:XP_001638582.1 predicted protein [Nematostella vectensis]